MRIPEPLPYQPKPGNWGFIVSWIGNDLYDRHRFSWFEGPFEMCSAVCLGDEFIRFEYREGEDDAHYQAAKRLIAERKATCEELFLATFRAFRSQNPARIWKAFSAVHEAWGSEDTLEWCGPFEDLLTGEGEFPKRLRKSYFEGRVKPPKMIPPEETAYFADWMCDFEGFIAHWRAVQIETRFPSRNPEFRRHRPCMTLSSDFRWKGLHTHIVICSPIEVKRTGTCSVRSSM